MYTSQGRMPAADYAEYLKDTDQGWTTIQLDDPPEWFEVGCEDGRDCPVCGKCVGCHESVTVTDASGEIFECVFDGERQTLPAEEVLPW